MSTGMRKWMEKGCPDIPTTPAEVSIDREELRQLRDELAQYKNEHDALRAKVEQMERQEPVRWFYVTNGEWDCYSRERPPEDAYDAGSLMALYALPGAQPAPSISPAGDGRALSDRAKRLVRLISGTHRGNIETHRELYELIDSMAVAVDSPPSEPAPSVPDGFAWPECPKRRQSHVLFDDGYEEGWAACVATIKAALAAPEAKP